jgi:hypothetical protein
MTVFAVEVDREHLCAGSGLIHFDAVQRVEQT